MRGGRLGEDGGRLVSRKEPNILGMQLEWPSRLAWILGLDRLIFLWVFGALFAHCFEFSYGALFKRTPDYVGLTRVALPFGVFLHRCMASLSSILSAEIKIILDSAFSTTSGIATSPGLCTFTHQHGDSPFLPQPHNLKRNTN